MLGSFVRSRRGNVIVVLIRSAKIGVQGKERSAADKANDYLSGSICGLEQHGLPGKHLMGAEQIRPLTEIPNIEGALQKLTSVGAVRRLESYRQSVHPETGPTPPPPATHVHARTRPPLWYIPLARDL